MSNFEDNPVRWWSVAFVVDETDARPLSRQEIFEIMHPDGVRSISVGPSGLDEPEEVASLKLELQASTAAGAQERAEGLLHRARRAVRLPDAIPSVAWVTPLTDDYASSARFLDKGEDLYGCCCSPYTPRGASADSPRESGRGPWP